MEAVEISWMDRRGHLQYVSEFVNVATQYQAGFFTTVRQTAVSVTRYFPSN